MSILKVLSVYFVGFVTLLVLDYIWLGVISKDFIIREFGSLITVENQTIKISLIAGLLAWLVISIMVVTFVTMNYNSYKAVLMYGALLGFLSYAMYDLTNYAFLNDYSLKFVVVDIVWGSFVCSMVALSSFYYYNLIK